MRLNEVYQFRAGDEEFRNGLNTIEDGLGNRFFEFIDSMPNFNKLIVKDDLAAQFRAEEWFEENTDQKINIDSIEYHKDTGRLWNVRQ